MISVDSSQRGVPCSSVCCSPVSVRIQEEIFLQSIKRAMTCALMTSLSIRSSVFEIPHTVTETLTATLEARERSFCSPRDETALSRNIRKRR